MAAPFLLSGSLDEIALPDVARLLNTTQKSGRLAVTSGTATGSIYFDRGDIVDSQSANLVGLDAIKHMALFSKGGFEFVEDELAPSRNLTTYPTVEVIRLLETRMQEAQQLQELMPRDREVPKYMGGAIPAGLEVSAAELAVALKSASGTLSTQQLAEELNVDMLMVRYTVARFRAAGLMEMAGYQTDGPADEPIEESPAPAADDPAAHPAKPKYWMGRKISG